MDPTLGESLLNGKDHEGDAEMASRGGSPKASPRASPAPQGAGKETPPAPDSKGPQPNQTKPAMKRVVVTQPEKKRTPLVRRPAGSTSEEYNLRDLYLDLEDILFELSTLDAGTIPHVTKLVTNVEKSAESVVLKLKESPQMKILRQMEASLKITPGLLISVKADLDIVGPFVAPGSSFEDDKAFIAKKVADIQPFLQNVAVCFRNKESPPIPTAQQLLDVHELHVALVKVVEVLQSTVARGQPGSAMSEGDYSQLSEVARDLKKTCDVFGKNVDLFAAGIVVFPVAGHLMRMRSLVAQLESFQEETLEFLSKFLYGKVGGGMTDVLRDVMALMSDGNAKGEVDLKVECSIELMELFMCAVQKIMAAPALETVMQESVKIFICVQKTRHVMENCARQSKGLPMIEDSNADLIAAAEFASQAVVEVLASMEAGNDSGVALFLKILRLLVTNRSDVISAKKSTSVSNKSFVGGTPQMSPMGSPQMSPARDSNPSFSHADAANVTADAMAATETEGGLICASELRKVALLLELSQGKFEVLPEVIASTGISIAPEKQQNLVQIITLIQSIKKVANKKDLSSLSAQDTIDIIATQMFNEFDIEGQGHINLDVFCMALSRMQLNMSPQEQRLLFSKADKDGGGTITQSEFRGIIGEIQDRFRKRMVVMMGLSKEIIYLTCLWIAVFLVAIFAFIIMGAAAFSDGTNFTAAITGMLPMVAGAVSSLKDPNALLSLMQLAEAKVKAFFEVLSEK